MLALIRTNVAQRTEGQEYPGERAQPGGRSTHWIPSDSTRRRGRCSKSLIPRGKMGRPEEICDGRAVSCFRPSELREWGGVVCRRRLLGNLNRRVTKSRLRNTVPSLDGKRASRRVEFGRRWLSRIGGSAQPGGIVICSKAVSGQCPSRRPSGPLPFRPARIAASVGRTRMWIRRSLRACRSCRAGGQTRRRVGCRPDEG